MPDDNEHIRVERDGEIMRVLLNRPEKMNALTGDMFAALSRIVREAAQDLRLRLFIVGGVGPAFCAGGDLGGVSERTSQADPEARISGFRRIQEVFERVAALPMPSIAAINGFALGAGLQLALACDFRIAARDATLGLPDVKNGIIPGLGATTRLPRLIGMARAKEMILTGDPIGAEKALHIGLVHEVATDLSAAVERLGRKLLSRAPLALSAAKHLLDTQAGLDQVASVQIGLMGTGDAREGIAAFFEKREPRFTGR